MVKKKRQTLQKGKVVDVGVSHLCKPHEGFEATVLAGQPRTLKRREGHMRETKRETEARNTKKWRRRASCERKSGKTPEKERGRLRSWYYTGAVHV